MASVAPKLEIVSSDEPAPMTSEHSEEPAARPDELRLLEAMLFAASEPVDEAALARRLPDGVDLKQSYVSPWFGERFGKTLIKVGFDGHFVAGIFGRKGLNCDAFGLIMMGDASAASASGHPADPTDDPNFIPPTK